jgi:hypothetical protein
MLQYRDTVTCLRQSFHAAVLCWIRCYKAERAAGPPCKLLTPFLEGRMTQTQVHARALQLM